MVLPVVPDIWFSCSRFILESRGLPRSQSYCSDSLHLFIRNSRLCPSVVSRDSSFFVIFPPASTGLLSSLLALSVVSADRYGLLWERISTSHSILTLLRLTAVIS
jgi:hypothetical protein